MHKIESFHHKSVVEIVFFLKVCFVVQLRFLPELAFLVLDRNFDDSWFVDNASGPLALFNDAYDPSLVAFLLFNVLEDKKQISFRLIF